jgi:hypothetical protein
LNNSFDGLRCKTVAVVSFLRSRAGVAAKNILATISCGVENNDASIIWCERKNFATLPKKSVARFSRSVVHAVDED